MATTMKIDDEIRLNILDALLKKHSVVPNIRQIQKYTGYHKATIKSSLDFLAKEGLLEGFGPKVNFKKLGYNLEVTAFFHADFSDKKLFAKVVEKAKADSNLYSLRSVIGSGNWNLIASHFYKDIESYHQGIQKNYYEAIPSIYKIIKDRQIFYITEPTYKHVSRTKALIEIIKKEKGYI